MKSGRLGKNGPAFSTYAPRMKRKGSCLCGALAYEIDGDIDGVWMCHCSNCRKVSGSVGNAIIIVPKARFAWMRGKDHTTRYEVRPTYAITRCNSCGTPLPAEEDETNVYLTAGTLDEPLGASVTNHIFYESRADWEHDAAGAKYFAERSTGAEVAPHQKPRRT